MIPALLLLLLLPTDLTCILLQHEPPQKPQACTTAQSGSASDTLAIQVGRGDSVFVYNLLGERVATWPARALRGFLLKPWLPSGVYFIRTKSGRPVNRLLLPHATDR